MTPNEIDRQLNRQREDWEIAVIIGAKDRELKRENKALKLHADCGSLKRGEGHDILSTCNNPKCRSVNNITKNRSVFCSECGMFLTDRHRKGME